MVNIVANCGTLPTFESSAFGLIDPELWIRPCIEVSAVEPNCWGACRRYNYAAGVNE
jgi:hypothetical protein